MLKQLNAFLFIFLLFYRGIVLTVSFIPLILTAGLLQHYRTVSNS